MISFGVLVLIFVYVMVITVDDISSSKRYSPLHNMTLIGEHQADVHSEYYLGECITEPKELLFQVNFTYEELKGQKIIRRPLNKTERPNCVYIRTTSTYDDMVNYRSYKFVLCVVKIIINYTRRIYKYYYYEWFLPVEPKEGLVWELFFYSEPKEPDENLPKSARIF